MMSLKVFVFLLIITRTLTQDVCEAPRLQKVQKNKTIISLNGNERSHYKWDVQFDRTGLECGSVQRCNLLAWEATRKLHRFLSDYTVDGKNPKIEIDNDLLLAGMKFFANLQIYENGRLVTTNRYTLPLAQKEDVEETAKAGFLTMIGPATSYADIEYFITANVTMCDGDNNNILVKWELLDDSTKSAIKTVSYNGYELRVPPKTFTPNKLYQIMTTLLRNDEILDIKTHKLNIRKRDLFIKLNTKALSIGVNQAIRLIASTDDYDTNINVEWNCKTKKRECDDFEGNSAILELEKGFPTSGSYNITATIRDGNEVKSDYCTVTVEKDITRTIELSEINTVINPSDNFEITARVNNLITGCLVEWTSPLQNGYQKFDVNSIPGFESFINVTTKEDAFLEELQDVQNDTVDKEFTLAIPARNNEWVGLKGDSSYLFRISVNCPPSQNESEWQKSNADFTFETNAPPKPKTLWVTPATGVALKTVFTFSTQEAEDKVKDLPILYKFGYVVNNRTVYFVAMGDYVKAQTHLPYSDAGVQTVLNVCDSKGSCIDAKGPKVVVKIPENISEKDDVEFQQRFNKTLISGDYYKAFTTAKTLLQTYSGFHNDLLEKSLEDFIAGVINTEFKRLLLAKPDGDFKPTANELIKNTKDLGELIKLPEDLLNNLIKLRAKTSEQIRARIVTDQDMIRLLQLVNNVGQKDLQSISLPDVKEFLEVSEFIISKSEDQSTRRDQKLSVLIHLDKYMGPLCALLYNGQQVKLELETIGLYMEKLTPNNFNTYTQVFYPKIGGDESLRFKFERSWFEDVKDEKLCIAKGVLKDYFENNSFNYFVNIYNANTNKRFRLGSNLRNTIVMDVDGSEERTCSVVNDNENLICARIKKTEAKILCRCEAMGFYSTTNYSLPNTQEETFVTKKLVTPNLNTETTTVPAQTLITRPATQTNLNTEQTTRQITTITVNTEITTQTQRVETTTPIQNNTGRNSATQTNNGGDNAILTEINNNSILINSNNNNSGIPSNKIVSNKQEGDTSGDTEKTTGTPKELSAQNKSDNADIKKASIISTDNLSKGDVISLIIIGMSILGMVVIGVVGAILNRVKRERTVETMEQTDFPKYANVFHEDTLDNVPTH